MVVLYITLHYLTPLHLYGIYRRYAASFSLGVVSRISKTEYILYADITHFCGRLLFWWDIIFLL